MSENAMLRPGAFSWCELMTTDVEAAKRFYTELLGWTEEVPGMSYTIVKTGGDGSAALWLSRRTLLAAHHSGALMLPWTT